MVFLIDKIPRLLPVIGVLAMPSNHVADTFVKLAALRNAVQTCLKDLMDILLKEGLCVHAADELTAVNAVSVIHQTSEDFAKSYDFVRQSRTDKA